MKTKLEELKAAYEVLGVKEACRIRVIESDPYRSHVVTAGCCVLAECNGVTKEAMGNFIALAHNMMPTLLKCASLVLECEALVREYPFIHQECRKVLKELV